MTSVTQAVAWAHTEQANLWSDLELAVRVAANGVWSVGASNVACRIIGAARAVGPTPWPEVPWCLLAGEVYATLLEVGAVDAVLPTEVEWVRVEPRMIRYGGSRETVRLRYLATCVAIRSDGSLIHS